MLIAQVVESANLGSNIGIIPHIWSLAVGLPLVASGVRRLHDVDRTSWWVLLWLVPIVGWIILIIWACQRGAAGSNRFGADPLA